MSIYDDAPQPQPLPDGQPDPVYYTVQLTKHEVSHILRCMYAFRFGCDYHTVHTSAAKKLESAGSPTH